jgi:hypothetical protein
MVEPTDIEKKNLEAHVELCAERYKMLELKLETVESQIAKIAPLINRVHDMVHSMADKRNDQLIKWGIGIIGSLTALVVWLASHYFKIT